MTGVQTCALPISIFDQVSASCEGNITYEGTIENLNVLDHDYYFRLDEAFLKSDIPSALLIYKEIRERGFDSQFFINGLAQHFRDLMVASNEQTVVLLEMNDEVAQRFVAQSRKFAPSYFYRVMDLCNYCDLNYREASNKQFLVELTLIKICQLLTGPMPPAGGGQPPVKKMQAPAAGAPQGGGSASAAPQASASQPVQAAAPQAVQTSAPQAVQAPAPPAKGAPASNVPRILIHKHQPAPQPATAPAPKAQEPEVGGNSPDRKSTRLNSSHRL